MALVLIASACPLQARAAEPPPIRHVWVINLENSQVCESPSSYGYDGVTGHAGCPLPGFADAAPYLGKVLPAEGTLVQNYFGIGHESLDNYIAEVSGQAPSPDTQADCPAPADLTPGTVDAPQQQAIGQGCTFPARVKTIADQLQAKGLSWKGYMEDMGNEQAKDASVPAAQTGGTKIAGSGMACSLNNVQDFGGTDNYVAKHNPFTWFHSIIDNQAYCDSHVVPLGDLRMDLQRIDTTPGLSFITPNMADDGHDAFVDQTSAWAAYWVRQILASAAYRQDGMVIIVYDESSASGTAGAAGPLQTVPNSCCGEIPGPNSPSPGAFGSQGGGQTGAWILTPYGAHGIVSSANSYNHYSLLRSLEDIFGITSGGADGHGHLGYAAGNGVTPDSLVGFGPLGCDDIFTTICPPLAAQVPAQAAPNPSSNVGPRRADGSTKWLNPAPQGNDLSGISCGSTTTCVAVGATGTIVSTDDGGSSWTARSSGTRADLNGVSCPSGSQLCVAVGAGGDVLASGDGGQTWSAQTSGTGQDLSAVTCPSATLCFAVGDSGTILSTSDGGATWSHQTSGTQHDLAQIACPDASHCYATGDFTQIAGSGPPVLGSAASVAGDVLATIDGGSTWSAHAPFGRAQRYRAIACVSATECVAGDEGGYPYTTSDGFQSIVQDSATSERLVGANCSARDGCVLVGDRGQIVQMSGGSVVGKQTLPSAADLRSVSCPSADACYAVGRGGAIFSSADGGATWVRRGADVAASNLARNQGFNYASYGGQAIGSLDLAGASCPSSTSCVAVGFLGAILTSTDGGGSWSARGGLGAPGSDPFDLPFQISGTGAPAEIPESLAARPLDAVSCASSSSCAAVGELGKVMTTSDLGSGGGTWLARTSNTSNRLTGVSCPSASSTCYAVGDYGTILKSIDAGSTWTAQHLDGSFRNAFLNGISCADQTHCVAVGVEGLIITTSDGSSWTVASSPSHAYLAAVSCASVSTCLAVGQDGTVLATTKGSSNWSARSAPSGDDLDAVTCAARRCVVAGSDGTVASSSNSGRSWALKGTGTIAALRSLSCPATGGCYVAGDNGAILNVSA